MWRRPRPHAAVSTSVGGGGGGGGETAGAWSSHASAAAAVQDTTARVVRTGAGRLCVAPAPAAASSHQSDVSRRDADIGSAGGGAAAAGGGGGGEAAGASPSRASAAAGECRRELGSFFYEGSWAVGRGDRWRWWGTSRTGWKNWKRRSGTSRIGCPGSLGYVMAYSISRVLNRPTIYILTCLSTMSNLQ